MRLRIPALFDFATVCCAVLRCRLTGLRCAGGDFGRHCRSWNRPRPSTPRAATSTSPTRSPARGRSISSSSRASSPTSSSIGRCRPSRPFLERLSSFCRLIRFDKRGTGMSDPVERAPTLETRMDDVRAVMDAVGSRARRVLRPVRGSGDEHPVRRDVSERTAALVVRSALPAQDVGRRLPVGPDRGGIRARGRARPADLRPARAGEGARPALGRFERRRSSRRSSTMLRFGVEPRRARGAPPDEQGDRHPARPAGGPRSDADPPRRPRTRSSRSRWRATWPRASRRPGSSRSPASGISPSAADSGASIGREIRELRHGRLGGRRLGGGRAGPRARDRALHRHRRLDREGGRARRPGLAGAARAPSRADPPPAGPLPRRASSTRRATASSPRFDGRRGPSAAPARSREACASSGSRSAPACTPASAS